MSHNSPTPPDLAQQIYLIVDELRGAANLSGYFATNVYERERSDQVRDLAQRLVDLLDDGPPADLSQAFDAEGLFRVSPAVGVEALVVNADDEILLCQRRDNEHWCLPGGIAEIGQPTPDAALRELWEEAGIRGEVSRLLGAFDGQRWGSRSKVHLLHLVYLVSCDDLTPSPGVEMIAADYFPPSQLPVPLHPGHGERIPRLIQMLETGAVHHDPASSYDIEMSMHQRPDPGAPR